MKSSKIDLVDKSRLRKSFGRLQDLNALRQTSEVFTEDRAVRVGSIVNVAKNVDATRSLPFD